MSGRLVPARVLLVALVGVAAILTGCTRSTATDANASTTAWVVEKVMPAGKLVGAGLDDGSLKQKQFPADIVPADALVTVDGIHCDVAAADLPAGTILRKSSFVDPAKLGLAKGLTTGSAINGC